MWTNKQKFLAHLYRQAADLPDQDYRDLLYTPPAADRRRTRH
jgi:hypothetical protein